MVCDAIISRAMWGFNLWAAPVLSAAILVLGVAVYVAVRWRRAPAAFRAMGKVAGLCFVAGFLAGAWALHAAGSRLPSKAAASSSSPSAASASAGSVSASEVGKAIVETDEKHAGDTMWVSSAATAELCNKGLSEADTTLCRVAYLARHAIGKDLDRGSHDSSVSLSEVADFCDSGTIDKSFPLCERAYAVRHAAMR
jgi:hypothetical protein